MTDTSTEQPEALMKLADDYAEACFDQALHQRTTDDKPEAAREKLEKELRRQHERILELESTVQFVERWAVHHGSKPSFTAESALSAIQHYPGIAEVTDSYADGKRPDTFNPYARIAELEAAQAGRVALSDAECDRLIKALCPDFCDLKFPGDRPIMRQLARDALSTNSITQEKQG